MLAGDIHSTWFSELQRDFDRPGQPPVAVEFVATSISSDFPAAFDAPLKAANPLLNPHVKYFDGSKRGYLRCAVDRGAWRTDVRTVETDRDPASAGTHQASYASPPAPRFYSPAERRAACAGHEVSRAGHRAFTLEDYRGPFRTRGDCDRRLLSRAAGHRGGCAAASRR